MLADILTIPAKHSEPTNKQTSNERNLMIITPVKSHQPLKAMVLIIALGAVSLLSGMSGCATGSRYKQSSGEHYDDSRMTSRVKSALKADTLYKYDEVNVATFKGVVQLSGFVSNRAQMARAGELSRQVVGVTDVQNNITVKE